MQVLEGNGIDWRERRLISQLYMDQSVKTGPGRDKRRLEEELDKDTVCR